MLSQRGLARAVELLADIGDHGALFRRRTGEGKRIESRTLIVAWAVLKCAPRLHRPINVNPRREHAKCKCVRGRDSNNFVVRQELARYKLKDAVFGGSGCRDETVEVC